MKRLLCFAILPLMGALAQAQEEDPGHMHGPDGRHIVSPAAAGGSESFILSHHDMRIEGPDGKSVLGCTVDSTIHRKGSPSEVIHTEKNAYEPENEVYGSHMTYKEPGEYVIQQAVTMPDGKKIAVEFPVYVPAVAGAGTEEEHAHGPNYLAIRGGILGGLILLWGTYRLGQKNARAGAGVLLAALLAAGSLLPMQSRAQEDEEGHAHGPDGRHIVSPSAGKSSGPALKAYPGPNMAESAEKVVDGIKFVLSIENEEMTPDPDLVSASAEEAGLIGLRIEEVISSPTGAGLQTTGQVSANPNGMVVVNARAAGRIVSLGALPGTTVRQGQSLAVIESPELADAQADHRRAQTEIAQAEAAVKIAASGVVSAQTRLSADERTLQRQRLLAAAGAFASPSLEAARSAVSREESAAVGLRVSLRSQEALVQRLERGVADGVVARRELDAARTELDGLKTKLADAEHQANLARQALAREEGIAARGLRNAREVESTQAEVDMARAALAARRNEVTRAQADLRRAQSSRTLAQDRIALLGGSPGGGSRVSIPAPISGEVERREVSVGQTVGIGDELFELLNADVVWVLCDLYERDIPRVRIGQKVEVVADALPDRAYSGEVAFIHNEVEPATRTTKVRVVVDNRGERLKQNMFVRVQLDTGAGAQVLAPTSAVQTMAGTPVVFVQEGSGVYRRVIVQVAGTFGDKTIVSSGLKPGQMVVTNGAYQLLAKVGAA